MPDSGYYNNERADVAALVPDNARTIFDVGCGRGRLGALLKKHNPRRQVLGLEINPEVAADAKALLDNVIVGDLQQIDLPFEHSFLDCVIFADVLEHMVNPASALRKIRPYLKPDGVVLCSIPNIRHYTTFLRLATRGWEYTDFGLFDRTHLRFFSLHSMEQLLTDAGYIVVHRQPRIIASKKMKLLNLLCLGRLDEFLAQQFLLIARPSPSANG